MPLPTNLNSNEVKNAAGTEVEYLFRVEDGRSREYFKSGEAPAYPERIKVQHRDVGGEGVTSRRQSNVVSTKQVQGDVDPTVKGVIRVSTSIDFPQGLMTDSDDLKDLMAKHFSFICLDGTGTTFLFGQTGTGAAALLNGTL